MNNQPTVENDDMSTIAAFKKHDSACIMIYKTVKGTEEVPSDLKEVIKLMLTESIQMSLLDAVMDQLVETPTGYEFKPGPSGADISQLIAKHTKVVMSEELKQALQGQGFHDIKDLEGLSYQQIIRTFQMLTKDLRGELAGLLNWSTISPYPDYPCQSAETVPLWNSRIKPASSNYEPWTQPIYHPSHTASHEAAAVHGAPLELINNKLKTFGGCDLTSRGPFAVATIYSIFARNQDKFTSDEQLTIKSFLDSHNDGGLWSSQP